MEVHMNIIEAVFLLSSTLVLPAIAVLIIAYFNGSLTATENARFIVLLEPEEDYWTQPVAGPGAGDHAPASRDDLGSRVRNEGGR
jgi:hypothetical protein